MDIEQEFDFEPLTQKTDKKLVLSHEAEFIASSIINRRTKTGVMNSRLDASNIAQKYSLSLKTKQFGNFHHFLTKNKHRDDRMEVIEVLRQLAQENGIALSGRVKDKLEASRMILRVLSKEEANGLVIIEDDTGKEKMQVRLGTVYVGMIACMEVRWVDGCYKLDQVLDLARPLEKQNNNSLLKDPAQAYRILFLKGPFCSNETKEHVGIKILANQIKMLREREKTKVDCIVVFGPLLHRKNIALTQGYADLTFEEETYELIKLIKDEITKISDEIDMVFVPSTDDLTNIYPIPQPKYNRNLQVEGKKMHYTSNPGIMTLTGARQNYEINLINSNLLQYIDENRIGCARDQNRQEQQNIGVYFKQPFYLTNAHEQPFDETNLPGLYNACKFGNIVVTSSPNRVPMGYDVRGRVFVNIGTLGMDQPDNVDQHYLTLLSIYDGEGAVPPRVKVESLKM